MQTYKFPESEKVFLDMLNQIFEIEKKLDKIQEANTISRNLTNLKNLFENRLYEKSQSGLTVHNPLGEAYDQTRLDCEASIAGESTENLVITEVIKPIIRLKQGGLNQIVQKAVVIVQSKNSIS
jgi:ferritin-like metal-binding protein YciE